jgi:hypothetical protein
MKKWLWLGLLALWAPSLWAAALMPDDFAYGIRVDVPQGTAIAAMSLPAAVYEGTCRGDLGDIRVFNAEKEPVPFLIRYSRPRAAEASWRSLTFFPLPQEFKATAGGYRVHVHTGADGAVVSVDPQTKPASSQPVRSYLIDVSRLQRRPEALRLEWQTVDANRMAAFAVDTSDDLVHWATLQPRAAIADIRYGGRRLLSNTFSLAPGAKRYLRLHRLDSGPAMALLRILGRPAPENGHSIRAFIKLDGRVAAGAPGVFEYETRGAFLVDRVNLIFDQANSMADATLESRPDSRAAWTRRFKGLFYRIDAGHPPLTNPPHPVPVTADRHWRLVVTASDSTIGSRVPRLQIGYRPHDLFFVVRGSGPFTLAFGSATVAPPRVTAAALFDGIGEPREKGFERWVKPQGNRIVLGGVRRLAPPPKPLPLRRIILWSILVAGVLVVGAMAWHLARRMKPV